MHTTINGDLATRVVVDTRAMPWTPSPGGSVWRKRLHLVGPAEAGQVTSLVRYPPNSRFHSHGHPDGEEILVLDGVFSDEHGDWPAGTYLLNPHGFRHAPYSRNGCELFVKLRQYPGKGRWHLVLDTSAMPWEGSNQGSEVRLLYNQPGFSDSMQLEQWHPGWSGGELNYRQGAELFVLEGSFQDEEGCYGARTWLRFPMGARHRPQTSGGCVLYVKKNGLVYLQSSADSLR